MNIVLKFWTSVIIMNSAIKYTKQKISYKIYWFEIIEENQNNYLEYVIFSIKRK